MLIPKIKPTTIWTVLKPLKPYHENKINCYNGPRIQTSTRVNFGHPLSHGQIYLPWKVACIVWDYRILCSTNSPTSVKKKTCCGRWPWFNYTIYDNHLPCQGAISKHAQKIGVLIPTRHLYGKANCRNCRTKTCRNKDATALDLDTNTQYIPKLHLFKRALLAKSSNMPPFLHEPYFCFEWQ